MPKYVNDTVAQKIANDINKNRVLLGAFDTLDTSNANYNLITRQTGYLTGKDLLTKYSYGTGASAGGKTYYVFNDSPSNYVVNGKFIPEYWYYSESGTVFSLDNNRLTVVTDSGADINVELEGIFIQYQLATTYTEKVIKGQPILNLDTNGCEFVREEWLKSLQLWDFSVEQGAVNATGGNTYSQNKENNPTRIRVVNLVNLDKNKTYTIKVESNYNVVVQAYNDSQSAVGITSTSFNTWANQLTFSGYSYYAFAFKKTSEADITPSELSSVKPMLNEGDHAYPYQPYNGAIVHEKEIENVAYKNVDNQFSAKQTINAESGNYALSVNSNNSSVSNIEFKANGTSIGFIGVNNLKPYWTRNIAGSKNSGELLTADDIAELKSLVYDNQYPAVATFETDSFIALPNSIDGDKLIFSVGTDITQIKGNSVVYNQKASSNYYEKDVSSSATISEGSEYYQNLSTAISNDIILGHKHLLIIKVENASSNFASLNVYFNNYSTIKEQRGNGTSFSIFDITNATQLFRFYSTNQNTCSFHYSLALVDLTQFFNGDIPSDLLSNPSLFTSKYYKGELSYDEGSIISASPVAVISNPFNIWDEEWEVGGINNDGSMNNSVSNRIRSKNFIHVNTGSTYYVKCANYGTMFWYDKDKNFISYENGSWQNGGGTIIAPSNALYGKFVLSDAYGTTYNHDICINISNSSMNGTYLPHIAPKSYNVSLGTERTTPLIKYVQLHSAGSVSDIAIAGQRKIIRKIGVIDLGDLSWTEIGSYLIRAVLTNAKGVTSGSDLANLVCSTKTNAEYNDIYNSYGNGITIFDISGTSYVYCQKSSADDTTPSGTLYYELAEYTEEEFKSNANIPTDIEMQKGGSIEIVSDMPIDMTFEVAVSKVY